MRTEYSLARRRLSAQRPLDPTIFGSGAAYNPFIQGVNKEQLC